MHTGKEVDYYRKEFSKTLDHLKKKKKILFLTTSNRWEGEKSEKPKSTQLAFELKKRLGEKVSLIEVPRLKIYNCEGNVSTQKGNNCGVVEAVLKDKKKNPSGLHRCWASINNKDDELWKISKELFNSDCVVFFGSVRWGQMNAYYQKLIERLTWIESGFLNGPEQKNIVKGIEAGIIIVGQNWRGLEILKVQKKVIGWFGFKVVDKLCWNWQYTADLNDESNKSYLAAGKLFLETFEK